MDHPDIFGDLVIDRLSRRVTKSGELVALTPSEYRLLAVLSTRPGAAMSDRDLLAAIWGEPWDADTTPLQVHVSRLRGKLGESGRRQRHIVTIHGFGYRFEPEPQDITDTLPPPGISNNHDGTREVSVSGLVSLSGSLLWVSDGVEAFLGWPTESLMGRHVSAFMDPEDRLIDSDFPPTASGTTFVWETRLRHRSGEWVDVLVDGRPVIDGANRVAGTLVTWRQSSAELSARRLDPIVLRDDLDENPGTQDLKD